MNKYYPHLFAPGKIGTHTIKNRIVQGPLEMQASGFNGEMSDDYIDFYEASAKNGTGLIITAYASVDEEFSQSFDGCQLRVTQNRHTGGLSKLARRIHKYDAKVIVQIYMAGRQSIPTEISGKRMVAPSPLGFSWHNQIPDEMTHDEIKGAVKKFVNAARILQNSGIDGCEVLAAGGYLINQFLSPKSNIRTDEYGGSFENRTRFVREVLEGIRAQCGPEFLLSVRFSADEFLEGGYDLDEGVKLAQLFESCGVDCININNSNQEKRYYIIEPIGMDTGWKSPIIRKIKAAVNVPVLSTNVIKTPDQAEQFLAEGDLMDFAVMARAFLADVEWAKKAREGRCNEVKPCIGCLHCLQQTAFSRRSICAVNPTVLRLDEFPERGRDLEGKRIVVVGAGPAGLEAAVELQKRGANVVVFERGSALGGALASAAKIPHKEPLQILLDYYQTMIDKYGVAIRYNTEATTESILAEKPYAVYIAAGSNSNTEIPTLKANGETIFTMDDILRNNMTFPDTTVAVIGGGMNACELAEYLATSGSKVTQVVRKPDFSITCDPDCVVPVMEHLHEAGGEVLFLHRPVEHKDGVLVTEHSETAEKQDVPAQIVALAVGSKPADELYNALEDQVENIYRIGDANHVGRVADAVIAGFEKAYILE